MKYRAEIDGLRALAVIPVILFHAGFELFSGGYVGVDVFFVISGYLITRIIVDELEDGKFSLVNFYERRTKRILPALFFYIAITIPFALSIFPPHAIKDFFQSVFATALFISNIFFYIETDYFNDFSETAPLLHTWSLSVEEQFYVVFPLLLMISSRLRSKPLLAPVILLSIASLVMSELYIHSDPSFSFYFIFTRFWELGFGGAAAIGYKRGYFNFNPGVSQIGALLGVLLVIIPMLAYSGVTPFPGITALAPVLGTLLILVCSAQNGIVKSILSTKILTYTGLISYSLYLSHNIVFAVFRNGGWALDNPSNRIFAIIISILLAIFSYKFVEQKIRRASISKKTVFAFAFIGIFAFSTIGYLGHIKNGFKEFILSNIALEHRDEIIDVSTVYKQKREYWDKLLEKSQDNFSNSNDKVKTLILGDSKSEDLYVAYHTSSLESSLEVRRMRLDDICMNVNTATLSNACKTEYKTVFESKLYEQANTIVLTATWQLATNSQVAKFVEELLAQNKKVKIISTANFNDVSSLSYVVSRRGYSAAEEEHYLFKSIRQDWQKQFENLRNLIENTNPNVVFIEKLLAFCDFSQETCKLRDGNDWYIYDSGHITKKGAKYLGNIIVKEKWLM